ncbi:hypothetical protein G6F42_013939 [Rhizopus arrhizus]|nr:hypothetical protein G6F42_013939 [Rhizopus arrhizus]
MKLRDRQKRVSNDIKQEDKKAVIDLINTPSSAPNESNAYSFNIKQEDTKNDSSFLQQDDGFEEGEDYHYGCDICNQRMPNLKSVLQHRNSTHNVKELRNRRIKDINMEPDVHDPNFYCRPCDANYKGRGKYRNHLRNVHFMVLKTIPKRTIPQNIILPDPDDPNQYCRACDHTYVQKSSYKQHCRYMHGMTSVKFGTAKSKPDGIADTYCKICDLRLASKSSYRCHLFAIHKVDWRLNQQKSKNIAPDVDDPNFYCCALHAIYLSAPKKIDLEPDTDDPNNNCRACKKNYISRSKYRKHLRFVHHMDLPTLNRNVNLGRQPDPNDPHHYCSAT